MVWQDVFPQSGSRIDVDEERELRLIAQARAGADWALAALVARYQPTVTRYLTRLTGNPGLSRTLAEDLFVRMERRLNGPRGEEHLRLWLLRACTETGLDIVRLPQQARPAQLHAPRGPAALIAGQVHSRTIDRLRARFGLVAAQPGVSDRQARKLVWSSLPESGSRSADYPSAGVLGEEPENDTLKVTDELLDSQNPREVLRHRIVRAVLSELPYGDAQCLALHLVAGLNQAEVGLALGIRGSAARRRIVQGLQLFSQRYEAALASLGLPPDLLDPNAPQPEEEAPATVTVETVPATSASEMMPLPDTIQPAEVTWEEVPPVASSSEYATAGVPSEIESYITVEQSDEGSELEPDESVTMLEAVDQLSDWGEAASAVKVATIVDPAPAVETDFARDAEPVIETETVENAASTSQVSVAVPVQEVAAVVEMAAERAAWRSSARKDVVEILLAVERVDVPGVSAPVSGVVGEEMPAPATDMPEEILTPPPAPAAEDASAAVRHVPVLTGKPEPQDAPDMGRLALSGAGESVEPGAPLAPTGHSEAAATYGAPDGRVGATDEDASQREARGSAPQAEPVIEQVAPEVAPRTVPVFTTQAAGKLADNPELSQDVPANRARKLPQGAPGVGVDENVRLVPVLTVPAPAAEAQTYEANEAKQEAADGRLEHLPGDGVQLPHEPNGQTEEGHAQVEPSGEVIGALSADNASEDIHPVITAVPPPAEEPLPDV